MRLLALLLVAASIVLGQDGDETTTPAAPTTTDEPGTTLPPVRQGWANLENGAKRIIDEQLRKLLPQMLRTSSEAGMSAECQAANFRLFQGLRGLKAWAVRSECRIPFQP